MPSTYWCCSWSTRLYLDQGSCWRYVVSTTLGSPSLDLDVINISGHCRDWICVNHACTLGSLKPLLLALLTSWQAIILLCWNYVFLFLSLSTPVTLLTLLTRNSSAMKRRLTKELVLQVRTPWLKISYVYYSWFNPRRGSGKEDFLRKMVAGQGRWDLSYVGGWESMYVCRLLDNWHWDINICTSNEFKGLGTLQIWVICFCASRSSLPLHICRWNPSSLHWAGCVVVFFSLHQDWHTNSDVVKYSLITSKQRTVRSIELIRISGSVWFYSIPFHSVQFPRQLSPQSITLRSSLKARSLIANYLLY